MLINNIAHCNIIKGEKRIADFLINNNIKFETQKKFDGLIGLKNGKLSYDFYLPEQNILIEYQGQQHEKPIDVFGGDTQFEIQREHDKRKKEFAEKNGIKLIEIWYKDFDNINDILTNILLL